MSSVDPPIRLLLADDAQLVRRGFSLILEAEPDIEVVGEARDGEEAVAEAMRLKPDLVLMDIQMPGVDGIEATRRIVAQQPETRVMMLTTFARDDYLFEALHAQASGFLLKNAAPEELVSAVRTVADGDALLSPSVTRRVIEAFAGPAPSLGACGDVFERLTERERQVLVLMAKGMSNQEIAEEFVLGESTVKTHVSHVLAKLGARDRVAAVVMAYTGGLVAPGGAAP